ncbi:sporulation/spore germination protein [Nostocales cyanobacterium HT-58-2]|nr:sporulation/spore germination protein [Nostocales cyanobacterium HT-58-2]
MNKIMKNSKQDIVPFIILVIITTISSCSVSPTSRHLESTTVAPNSTTNNETSAAQTQTNRTSSSTENNSTQTKTSSSSGTVTKKTINVTLFTSDTQCQELIPQQVSVPAEEPVTSAVGKIIEQRNSADFSLSGYRVTVKDGVATVDLRISPNSLRQFTSLSSCEQFALFGSLRKTLLSNSQWDIKKVNFTERGKKIVL